MPRIWLQRGGQAKKILGVTEGSPKKILSSFAVTAVSVITESLSNEDGNGIENVTQKVNSHCFKLHRSFCNSFNSSNVGVFFQELNSIKDCIKFTKRKRNLSFFFSVLVFCFVLLFFFFGGGEVISIILGKKGGTRKIF